MSNSRNVSGRRIVGRGHRCDSMGSYEDFTWYVSSHMRPFLFGCHISFCCFFALEVTRGHDFWTHLKMCVIIFDLFPPILESGTVSGEMGS